MSYLAIEGYHAFVTGALGGIGSAIVEELLGITARVT
jgi:NAD(P)-dependent dehydrogenase (short-subunit alcohol dehydrogenase family)